MTWQSNLFNNLLVIFILSVLAIIIYCKVAKKTFGELIKEMREINE
jgi:hypothetical protein